MVHKGWNSQVHGESPRHSDAETLSWRILSMNTFLEFPGRYVELTDAKMQALDDIDRRARAEGRHEGHTHAVVSGICVRADGRHLGRSPA